IRKMMRDEKIDKITDWSWISIRNKIYAFKFDNKKHQSDDVAKLLEDLLDRARPLGYQVETNSEMVDEEKEEATTVAAHHSEKLAVAFGLLNTSINSQIRLTRVLACVGTAIIL
ncbi:hypothetical protein Pfo_000499, partial [Paulownia fortunei]